MTDFERERERESHPRCQIQNVEQAFAPLVDRGTVPNAETCLS